MDSERMKDICQHFSDIIQQNDKLKEFINEMNEMGYRLGWSETTEKIRREKKDRFIYFMSIDGTCYESVLIRNNKERGE